MTSVVDVGLYLQVSSCYLLAIQAHAQCCFGGAVTALLCDSCFCMVLLPPLLLPPSYTAMYPGVWTSAVPHSPSMGLPKHHQWITDSLQWCEVRTPGLVCGHNPCKQCLLVAGVAVLAVHYVCHAKAAVSLCHLSPFHDHRSQSRHDDCAYATTTVPLLAP